MHLGEVTRPDTFGFVLKLTVCPFIQLKIPPTTSTLLVTCFSKERLTPEETYEEMCVNELLPKPFHPELSKVPHKHPTMVFATAVHFLIQKRMLALKFPRLNFHEILQ